MEALRLRGYREEDYRIVEVPVDESRPVWDRLPPLIAEGIHSPPGPQFDRGPDRPPLRRLPTVGRIEDLRDTRKGRCVVMGNGPSLAAFDLNKIRVPIIGCNRTFRGWPGYDGPSPDYLCVIDIPWLQRPEVRSHPRLINLSTDGAAVGYRVTKSYRMDPWSFDLARDGAVHVDTGYCAMQVAGYLGFEDIYLIGFEGPGHDHFDGTRSGSGMQNQAKYFCRIADLPGMRFFTVGFDAPDHDHPDGRGPAFPRVDFEALTED